MGYPKNRQPTLHINNNCFWRVSSIQRRYRLPVHLQNIQQGFVKIDSWAMSTGHFDTPTATWISIPSNLCGTPCVFFNTTIKGNKKFNYGEGCNGKKGPDIETILTNFPPDTVPVSDIRPNIRQKLAEGCFFSTETRNFLILWHFILFFLIVGKPYWGKCENVNILL